MATLKIGLLILIGYIIVYSIVDRICKCIENKDFVKSYTEFLQSGGDLKNVESFRTGFQKDDSNT